MAMTLRLNKELESALRGIAAAEDRPIHAVVVSAIVDALRDFGVHDVQMPATSYRIWKLIREAKAPVETLPTSGPNQA